MELLSVETKCARVLVAAEQDQAILCWHLCYQIVAEALKLAMEFIMLLPALSPADQWWKVNCVYQEFKDLCQQHQEAQGSKAWKFLGHMDNQVYIEAAVW